ncbi:MAG: glycosyltransferase [Halanaerobiaceae bacterium]|nr:glycosyltransferase [Halanaerobiaceae bacterium]
MNINQLGIGIPPLFFTNEQKRKKKIVIGGNQIEKEELEKIFAAIEKATPSFSIDEVIIISPDKIAINTELDFLFLSEEEIRYKELFSESFFLIWLDKNNISPPIIPLWAMASDLIVLGINLAGSKFNYPLELNNLDSMELALELIKIYKMGQYRSRILYRSREIAQKNKLALVGENWYDFLKGVLNNSNFINKIFPGDTGDYLVDLIIESESNHEEIDKCIKKIKEYTDLPCFLTIISNSSKTKNLEAVRKSGNQIRIIEGMDGRDRISPLNRGIVSGNAPYIVLMKDYIEVSEGWLEPLIETAEEEKTAVVIPKIVYDKSEKPDDISIEDIDIIEKIPGNSSACFLIKRELLTLLGLIDEDFQELKEMDYFYRVLEKGYRIVCCNESELVDTRTGELVDRIYDDIRNNTVNYDEGKRFKEKWAELFSGNMKRGKPASLIFFGPVSWNYDLKRIHDLVYGFARKGYQLLYINPVCGNKGFWEMDNNIFIYTPPGSGTVNYNLKEGHELYLGKGIREAVRHSGFENPLVIMSNPVFRPLLKYLEYGLLIYDCPENYYDHINSDFQREAIQLMDLELIKRADLVLVNSDKQFEKIRDINKNIYVLKDNSATSFRQNWITGIDRLISLIEQIYCGDDLAEIQDNNFIENIAAEDIPEEAPLKISDIEDFDEFNISIKRENSWFRRLKKFFTG